MGLSTNYRYNTKYGGFELYAQGFHLVIRSRHAVTRLRMDKVREIGILMYLQRVGTMQMRANPAIRWKYNSLQRMILEVQSGRYNQIPLPSK